MSFVSPVPRKYFCGQTLSLIRLWVLPPFTYCQLAQSTGLWCSALLQKTVLPALLQLNHRRFSSIHSAYTHYAPLNRFTTSPPELWRPTLLIFSSSVSDLIVSISYCTITPKYFALSDFETHLVREVDNIDRGDVSFDARGISFFLQSVCVPVSSKPLVNAISAKRRV